VLGNGFPGFQSAAVGNVQIPVMYAVGPGRLSYGLFLDNVYQQRWDFEAFWWSVRMFGDQVRFYLLSGPDLSDIRKDYLELVGTPPVPPRKAFGLWVSEFGYDNWGQIDALRDGLRAAGFPVDGFVLDLNWFGGVVLDDPTRSRMGTLDWDQSQSDGNGYFFPDPGQVVRDYAADHLGLAVIEESYLADTTDTFSQMPAALSAYRRTGETCDPAQQGSAVTDVTGFWGKGRMVDWSDPEAGRWIHDRRRRPNLVQKGVTVHWTDLGEPERFEGSACYEGVETTAAGRKNEHPDVHNLYNLLWNRSIWNGYFEHRGQADGLGRTNPRPLVLTRSGAAGIQRYGAAMWSGDIASNLQSLATHLNAQMHMSFSGIDYYGADVGGFRREVLPYNNDAGAYRGYDEENYTQWLANAAWLDVPVRPHTDNEFKRVNPPYPTAPHLTGKRASNLANLRQRYELVPYYYSLAYRAHLFGEPLVPPLVLHYQDDPRVRGMGHEKLVGRDLLVAAVARYGEYERDVYLPAGEWVNYHTHEWVRSGGETLRSVPVYREGLLRLPVFARAGAILPQMHVDGHTKDAFGHRADGSRRDELILKVFADAAPTEFTLYEDDGTTLQYRGDGRPVYHHRTTRVRQQQTDPATVTVTIHAAVDVNGPGPYPGAATARANVVRLVVRDAEATRVTLDGADLVQHATPTQFETASSGWHDAGPNVVLAKSDALDVYRDKTLAFTLQPVRPTTSVSFVCDRGVTLPGESIYVVGSLPQLGGPAWDTGKAVKLAPSVYYEYISRPPPSHNGPGPSAPVWTGVVSGLPPDTDFEWKCIRKREDGSGTVAWQPGDNNRQRTGGSGYSGRSYGSF
jgi:alpha-glucosidase